MRVASGKRRHADATLPVALMCPELLAVVRGGWGGKRGQYEYSQAGCVVLSPHPVLALRIFIGANVEANAAPLAALLGIVGEARSTAPLLRVSRSIVPSLLV